MKEGLTEEVRNKVASFDYVLLAREALAFWRKMKEVVFQSDEFRNGVMMAIGEHLFLNDITPFDEKEEAYKKLVELEYKKRAKEAK